jgi:hypothetical protein
MVRPASALPRVVRTGANYVRNPAAKTSMTGLPIRGSTATRSPATSAASTRQRLGLSRLDSEGKLIITNALSSICRGGGWGWLGLSWLEGKLIGIYKNNRFLNFEK